MIKIKVLILFTLIGLCTIMFNPISNTLNAQTVTFEEQFPNPHTAEVVAAAFGKTASDVIDEADLLTSSLSLSNQELTDITGITIFTELSGLFLDNNQLVKLPDNFDELSNLRLISLDNNQLTSLPNSFLTMVSRFSFLGLQGNLLPSDYEVLIQQNGNSHSYLTQDKLVVDPTSNVVTITNSTDLATLNYPSLVNLQSGKALSSEHVYMLENYVDENMQPVNIDDYFFSNGVVKKSGKVYAQVRATGTGIYPNTSDNALTDNYIELNFKTVLYNLSFDLNGGEGVVPAIQTLLEGALANTPQNPMRNGYKFMGWNTAIDGSGTNWNFMSSTMPASNVILYAQWEKATSQYTLTFDLNGGEKNLPANQVLNEGQLASQPANPIRVGYTFKGWNILADGSGDMWNFTTDKMPPNDVVLYAQWEKTVLPETGIERNSVILFGTLIVLTGARLIVTKKIF